MVQIYAFCNFLSVSARQWRPNRLFHAQSWNICVRDFTTQCVLVPPLRFTQAFCSAAGQRKINKMKFLWQMLGCLMRDITHLGPCGIQQTKPSLKHRHISQLLDRLCFLFASFVYFCDESL